MEIFYFFSSCNTETNQNYFFFFLYISLSLRAVYLFRRARRLLLVPFVYSELTAFKAAAAAVVLRSRTYVLCILCLSFSFLPIS